MNVLSPTMNSPFAAGQTARKRKQYAASLLVGWFAFWLTVVIAPCCESLIANALAGQESTSSQYSVRGPAGGDYNDALCPASLSTVKPVLPALMTASFCSASQVAHHASPATFLLVPSAVASSVNGFGERSPPPIPIYLRTARLLI
jgi:hypothetical protein